MSNVNDNDLSEMELFNIDQVKIDYTRTKDETFVSVKIRDEKPISEMKLYLILDMECRKLERRLGIHDGQEDISH